MYYFNDKLLLSLLLSSTLLIAHGNQDNKKESSLKNDLVLNTCEDLPGKLLSCVILKRYAKTLPAEKFIAAEILKRYIAHNTKYSKDTAEKIAQCAVSPLIRGIESKEEDNTTYRYKLDNPLISVPKTLAREFLLSEFTRLCHEAADKLEIKHPPEIKENEKLYQGGKFLIKSIARHTVDSLIDYGLSKLFQYLL